MRPTILLICGLLLLASTASSCSSAEAGGTAPSQQALLVNAARSLSGATSVRFDAIAEVSAMQNGKDIGGDASLRGGVARHAVSLDGSVKVHARAGEETLPFGLRVTGRQLYVNVLGRWYSASLDHVKRQALKRANTAARPGERQSLLRKLHTLMAANDIAGHAFTGEVSRGSKLDGTDTWQWQGTVDPDGALAMLAKYAPPAKLDAAKRALARRMLEQLAKLSTLTVIAGTDGRPRRAEVKIDANAAQLASLTQAAGAAAAAGQLSELHASVRIDLSHWNEHVSVTAPSGAKPIEQLFHR